MTIIYSFLTLLSCDLYLKLGADAMDQKTELSEFESEVIRTFQNPDGTIFRKFRTDAFRNMIKNKDYPGMMFFLDNIKKHYEGFSPKFERRLEKYEKGYARDFKKGVEIIKSAKKAEIEALIEKLKKIKEEGCKNKKS